MLPMADSPKRLVRCPACRLHFETIEATAVCVACGHVIADAPRDPHGTFEDETPERSPTRKVSTIPPRK